MHRSTESNVSANGVECLCQRSRMHLSTESNASVNEATCVLELKNHALARTELHVLVDKNGTTVCNIRSLIMRTDNLCITGNIQLVCLVLAVDNRHHILTLILAGNYVNTLLRTELGLLALGNHFIALTPVQQVAEPVEHLVFCLCSSLLILPLVWEMLISVHFPSPNLIWKQEVPLITAL